LAAFFAAFTGLGALSAFTGFVDAPTSA
jgi:hypothetical protein